MTMVAGVTVGHVALPSPMTHMPPSERTAFGPAVLDGRLVGAHLGLGLKRPFADELLKPLVLFCGFDIMTKCSPVFPFSCRVRYQL
jgi:hypothetical protein